MHSEDLQHFPANYSDSRDRFRLLAHGTGDFGSWPIPSATETDLFTDHLYLPPLKTPKRLFVILSGVHGLEAYAGAGLQFLFLREFLGRLDRDQNGFFLVHALNPFGFKHHTRATENRVNLNRNCSIHPDLYLMKNPESLAWSDRFIPKQPVASEQAYMLSRMRTEGHKIFFDEVAMDELVKSVGRGQFEDPRALEFGGRGPEPQITLLIERLKTIVSDYQDLVLYDLHTGLGDYGRLHLLDGDIDGCTQPELFAELLKPVADRQIYDHTSNDTEGFYKTYGATNQLFPELAGTQQRCLAVTLEFGTLGHSRAAQIEGLNRWLLEHQGALYGYANAQLETRIRSAYLERFFPQEAKWRELVIQTGRAFFETTLHRAGALKGLSGSA